MSDGRPVNQLFGALSGVRKVFRGEGPLEDEEKDVDMHFHLPVVSHILIRLFTTMEVVVAYALERGDCFRLYIEMFYLKYEIVSCRM